MTLTMSVPSLLLLLALICFVIAAVGVPIKRLNVLALGLAFLAAHFYVA